MKRSPSAGAKLAGFAVALIVVLGAAFGVARAVSPDRLSDRPSGGHSTGHAGEAPKASGDGGGHGGGHAGGQVGGQGQPGHGSGATTGAAVPPGAAAPGLAVAEAGYRFAPEAVVLAAGPAAPFRFRIEGADGKPVQRYELLHERELHLIVVRRDLTGFQHVHPVRAADGTWSIDLDLQTGGTWRAFADFAPSGGPAQLTLGVDLQVAGAFVPGTAPTAAVPADSSLAVAFDRRGDEVEITVRRNGVPIEPEPYLGARGHLVALRGGDLAYLHVHPSEGGAPAVRFSAELPTPGSYALFFDYQVSGVVRTGVTTVEVPR